MQLLMRRPEIDGFICVAPPANLYDYSFLAPCPSSGLMVNGDKDRVVPTASVAELAAKTKVQKGVKIEHAVVPEANHFFQDRMEDLMKIGRHLPRPAHRRAGAGQAGVSASAPRCSVAAARTPPVSGLGTPVVPGNVIGRPLSERTAR